MGRFICKIPYEGEDYYLIWSSIVDAPVTFGMKLEEFTDFMREEEGQRYMKTEHSHRMERVDRFGTSIYRGESVEDLIILNRCGPQEQCLTLEDIIKKYIVRRERDDRDMV